MRPGDKALKPVMTRPACLLQFDRLSYDQAWTLQHRMVEERAADRRPDTLLLLEHDPVYTIGRSGRNDHWGGSDETLRQTGYSLYHVERGGSVTFHGPGQVVGYPILRLTHFCSGPKAYVGLLEETLIRVLAAWGLPGRRREKMPGVWIEESPPLKIASLGVRITKGVTMHGFALNVAVDLAPFRRIQPCGIPGDQVTSMAALLGREVESGLVREQIVGHLAEVFGLEWVDRSISDTASCCEATGGSSGAQGQSGTPVHGTGGTTRRPGTPLSCSEGP